MKKLFALTLSAALFLAGCGSSAAASASSSAKPSEAAASPSAETSQTWKDGTYTASARGRNGDVNVTVTIADNAIKNIDVDTNLESHGICEAAVDLVPQEIIDNQNLTVDYATGATFTSSAIVSAVGKCIDEAGGDHTALQNLPKPSYTPVTEEKDTDVLVVGAGLAGLSAAIAAKEAGVDNVMLLEQNAYAGGSTQLSTGVFNLGGTDLQKENGVQDSQEKFAAYLTESSAKLGGERDPVLVKMVASNSNSLYHWLSDNGVKFADHVFPVIGSDTLRGHQSLPDAVGLVDDLEKTALDNGVDIEYNTRATKLVTDGNGKVTGVTATRKNGDTWNITSKSGVILASGGFGQNAEMMKKYWGLDGLTSVCGAGLDGILLEDAIENLNAKTRDMQIPSLSPTVSADGTTLISSLVLSNGAILVKSDGERYTDESASYGQIAAATLGLDDPVVTEVFDQTDVDNFYKLKDYIKLGLTVQADTLDELAEKIDVPADALKATVQTYNDACDGKAADPFNRQHLGTGIKEAPFYGLKVKSGAIIFTSGGFQVDDRSAVVDNDGNPIPGLYAAGEIVGGYQAHGYSGGDSLAMCAATGRTAGYSVAEDLGISDPQDGTNVDAAASASAAAE